MTFKRQSKILLIGGLSFFILDRILKYIAFDKNYSGKFFNLVKNKGIAFGLRLAGPLEIISYILIAIIFIILVFFAIKYFREHNFSLFAGVSIATLGAASNIVDRMKFGFVVDYIDLHFWPVFNIADAMIVIGIIFIFGINFKKLKKEIQTN